MRLTTHELAICLLEPIKTQIFHVPAVNGGVLGEFSPAVYTPLWYIDRGPPHGETLNDPFACMLSIIEQDAGGGGGGGGGGVANVQVQSLVILQQTSISILLGLCPTF